MDKISIVVPIYNIENYIEKCVESIIKQTYKDIEIILVDDGAKDNSGKIIDELAKKDNRIKVIHKKNGGLSSARNAGIKEATGKYICFIDGDDYVREDFCSTLYNALIETKSDIAVVGYEEIIQDENLCIYNSKNKLKSEYSGQQKIYTGDEIIVKYLKDKIFRISWNKLYNIELVRKNLFQEGVTFEDMCFSYGIMSNIEKAVYIDTPCYYYIRREGSISVSYTEKNLGDFVDNIIEVFNNVNKKYPQLDIDIHYSLLQLTISSSMKYVASQGKFAHVEEQLKKMFDELCRYSREHEAEFIGAINDWYKICLYMIRFNKKMYYKTLKSYQKLQEENII